MRLLNHPQKLGAWLLGAVVCLSASQVRAAEPEDVAPTGDGPLRETSPSESPPMPPTGLQAPDEDNEAANMGDPAFTKKKKKRKKEADAVPRSDRAELKTAFGTFAVRGHVFMLAEYQRRNAIVVTPAGTVGSAQTSSLDLLLRDARVAIHYHDPDDWLSMVLDLRISDKPKMKNAFVQAKGHHLLARLGQFKMPMSSIEMESSWVLPTIRHGFLHELLVKRLDVAGRRPGVMFAWHGYGPVHPRLILGAFQGSVVTSESAEDRKTDFLRESSTRAQSLLVRAELESPSVHVGAYYENRMGSPGTLRTDHYWTAGLDLAVDQVFERGGLRIWADVLAGASWFELREKPRDNSDATFVAARAIVAYRFGGTTNRAYYLEPFAVAGALDPDVQVATDRAWEASVGLGAGLWNRARLTLQGEVNKAQRNFPDSYFVGPPPNRVAIMLQAGAAF